MSRRGDRSLEEYLKEIEERDKKRARQRKETRRPHRRQQNNRTLAVQGSAVKKYGVGKKSAKIRSDTRRYAESDQDLIEGGPIVSTKPNKQLRESLRVDDVFVEIGPEREIFRRKNREGRTIEVKRGTGFPTPRMRVNNKKKKDFNNRGIIVEAEKGSSFTLTTFDTLYAYQLGLLGKKGTRKRTFEQIMSWATINDPDFMEKYLIYMALRDSNFIVVDGYAYGVTFAFVEPMPKDVINEIKDAPPDKVGPSRDIAIMSGGLVDVVPVEDNMRVNELIKGQHMATKNDLRYYTAQADGFRDTEGHLVAPGDGVTIALLRKDRLSKPFTDDVETLILNNPSAFEFSEDE